MSRHRFRPSHFVTHFVVLGVAACGPGSTVHDAAVDTSTDAAPPTPSVIARHSSSIAISPDGATLYVANADADSVSVIDTAQRRLVREIPLGTAPPAVDPVTSRYDVAIGPRALALAPRTHRLYVTAQRSGELIEVDLDAGAVSRRVAVGSEPIGVIVDPLERDAYVACSQDAMVVEVDLASATIATTRQTAAKPWALAWSTDGAAIYVTHLLGPGLTTLDAATLATRSTTPIPDAPSRGDRLLAYGQARGLYDVVVRPNTDELWVPHLMLANETAQAAPPGMGLDFESTAFPTVSIVGTDGTYVARLTTQSRLPGTDGQFADVVSGPHAVEFTPDGRFALVVDTDSEDVLAIDASPTARVEATLLRPLPGHMPEGIVMAPDGAHAYVEERNSGDVIAVSITIVHDDLLDRDRPVLAVDGAPIPRLATDPMPANLRLGQHLFFSANSDEYPITQNHWLACASCHIEARSDAVVWRFLEGPRDTPSNAGGVLHTGFLMHTADRQTLRDYWHTINFEQGGSFAPTDPTQSMLLDALAAYVNDAIPYPSPPRTDATRVAHGNEIFHRSAVGCAVCHQGDYFTDSGLGNPTLDLSGMVVLHDVGTCDTGSYPDVAHLDVDGNTRAACLFDTPSLRGVADSAPYFHDGSAATLHDVLENTRGRMGDISSLSADDEADLIEYLRSL